MNDEDFAQQPDEINDVKKLAKEFINRWSNIQNEIDLLKQDQKDLKEEYADKLDVKELERALQIIKVESKVKHRDTFDTMVEALRDPAV